MMIFIKSLIKLLRPKQWTKNSFVFAVLVFSGTFFNREPFLKTLAGFAVFCMISSCVYIMNDIFDREKDRNHPKKHTRPIASGTVTVPAAVALLCVLLGLSLAGAFYLNIYFAWVILSYFFLNLLYSLRLKHIPILDVMSISMGFVLRALSGSFLIGVSISPWLIVCTLLLALFLAIHKRKSELARVDEAAGETRDVLKFYTAGMLRDMSSAIDSSTIMAYCLYTINHDQSVRMMITIPFVIYGLFRYQLIIHTNNLAETPDIALLKDKPLLISIFLWAVLCMGIIYFS